MPFALTSHERNTKTLRILKENTTLFKWMIYNREKREYYERYLKNYTTYINNDYLPKCNQYNQEYGVVRNVALETCWKDFLSNPVQYYGFLEMLVGVRKIFYEDANMSAMPTDLILSIEDTELDLEYLDANLRNYQDFGTKFIVHQKRVLLGDEMGLGKTMQAIAMICHLVKQGKKRFLVVCPLSVLVNWVREIDKFTKLDVIEQIDFHLVIGDDVLIPFLTEIVNDQIMCDTHDPRLKLTVLRVSTLLDGHDDLHKGLLENIFRQFFVAYDKIYIRMNTALVTIQ